MRRPRIEQLALPGVRRESLRFENERGIETESESAVDVHDSSVPRRDAKVVAPLQAPTEPFYAQRVDDLVTVYYRQETHEVIGSLIKGASRFCSEILKRLPGFRIEVIDRDVRLEHIFRAKLWSAEHDPGDLVTITYRKLIKAAEETGVTLEGGGCQDAAPSLPTLPPHQRGVRLESWLQSAVGERRNDS